MAEYPTFQVATYEAMLCPLCGEGIKTRIEVYQLGRYYTAICPDCLEKACKAMGWEVRDE